MNTATEKTVEKTCEKHGAFTATVSSCKGLFTTSDCPICTKEFIRRHEEAERAAAEKAHICYLTETVGIPPRFLDRTLDNFAVETVEQRSALEVVRDYILHFDDNLRVGRCLLFCGDPGRGKTHLACGMAHALLESHRRVRYCTAQGLIRELRDTWRRDSERSESGVLKDLVGFDLLIVDEVGMQYGSDAEKVQLFEVINGRYNAVRPTFIISNLGIEGMIEHLGDRLVDRLRENEGQMLLFKGASWRGR